MIIDNFLYLPFHGSPSHKSVRLYSHNLPDIFMMIFMEFTEEKGNGFFDIHNIWYIKCDKPRSPGFNPALRGYIPLSVVARLITARLELGLQPSGDSAASHLIFM